MDTRTALRWTAIYRGISWLSGLVALGFVYLGFYLSLGGMPLDLGTAIQGAKSPLFAGPALVGFLVWQLGKTAAYYKTVAGAVDAELARRFDPEVVKSDILSVLDERLAEMQTQVEGTRRAVEEMDDGTATTGGFEFENQ